MSNTAIFLAILIPLVIIVLMVAFAVNNNDEEKNPYEVKKDNDEKDKEIPKSEISHVSEESKKYQSEIEYLKNISKNTNRIKNNIVFFFWLTVISILVYFLSSIFNST